jgi:GTP-binding protein
MSFVDKVQVHVQAGDGGNGKLSFRHEKFISKGGPDGGDGGNGGDIILLASRNQNTLATFRYQKEVIAAPGKPGDTTNKHGRNGKNLLVAVPVGTIATNQAGRVVADLTEDQQQVVVAQGGKGGYGNAHFVSSRRQAPNFAEKGEPGEAFDVTFELKLIADVGLVGLPNAGKSTLLSRISNARPEIADYPFTTLTPNLGVVDINDTSILVADIPGLIEGAASGKGLGHDFLRHIERTAVVLHLIEAYNDDVASTYSTVKAELKAYQPALAKRPEIVVLTKIEGLDDEIVADLLQQLALVVPKRTPMLAISSQSGQGLQAMLYKLQATVTKARAKAAAKVEKTNTDLPVLRLDDTSDAWQVVKDGKQFVVTGRSIERFASRTDFGNEEGVQRLRDIMRRTGVMHELVRSGIEPGDSIVIGTAELTY